MSAVVDDRDCACCGSWSPHAETCLHYPFTAGCMPWFFCSWILDAGREPRSEQDIAESKKAEEEVVSAHNCCICCCAIPVLWTRGDDRPVAWAFNAAACCFGPPLCLLTGTLCCPFVCTLAQVMAENRYASRYWARMDAEVKPQVAAWEQVLGTPEADREALHHVVRLSRGLLPKQTLDPRALYWASRVAATGPQESQDVARQVLTVLKGNDSWRAPALSQEDAGLVEGLLYAKGPEAAAAADAAMCRALVRRVAAGTADALDRRAAELLSSDQALAEALSWAEESLMLCLQTDGPEAQTAACRALLRLAAAFRGGTPHSALTEELIALARRAGPGVRSVAAVVLKEICPSFSSERVDVVAGTLATLVWSNQGNNNLANVRAEALGACQALAHDPACHAFLMRLDPPVVVELPSVRPEPSLGLRGEAWDEEAHRCIPFWFVRADKIRAWRDTDPPPPRFQDLKRRAGWMEAVPISAHVCFHGYYRQRMLAVSHRWERPDHPDPSSTQLKIMRTFLHEHPDVEFVWLDWYCLPQGHDRTDEENAYFKLAQTNANLLYLGLTVLTVYDQAYPSRFWCLLEAWYAMRCTTAEGLGRAPPEERRLHVRCTGAAAEQADLNSRLLFEVWENKRAVQLYDELRKEDILVTNQGDKDTQLQKLEGLRTKEFAARSQIDEFVARSYKAGLTIDMSGDDTKLLPSLQANKKAWNAAAVPESRGGSQLAPPDAQQMQARPLAVPQADVRSADSNATVIGRGSPA